MKKIFLSLVAFSVVLAVKAQEIPERKTDRHPGMHQKKEGMRRHHGMNMKNLNLTETQKEQFKKEREGFKKQMEELKKNDNITVKEWRAKMENMRKEHKSKLNDILTAEQKAQIEKNKEQGKTKQQEYGKKRAEMMKISVKVADKKTGKFKEPKVYEAPAHVRDMIGGFLYLRIMDFSDLKLNDTILVKGFFEDEFYRLRIVYKGKKTIKTKIGKIRTLVFRPIMPKNQLFDGENSITAYFSDDKNRIPVKIDAQMFIGSAGVELTDYSGLRNPLNIVKR